MLRTVFVALLLVALGGCVKSVDQANVGEYAAGVYVRDMHTGKCVYVEGSGTTYKVVEPSNCGFDSAAAAPAR